MQKTLGWLLFAGLLVAGCGGDVKAKVSVPSAGATAEGSAGYKTYVRAAESVEDRATKYIGRTAWSPDQRDSIVASSSEAIRMVAGVKSARFGQTWKEPFRLRENTRGWRTIGRALAWRAETAIKNDDFADARHCLAVALQMANALASSDSHDAAMGLEIIEEVLSAVWPALPRFPAGVLQMVSSDVRETLESGPSIDTTIAQERALMLAQVAWVRDRYQDREFEKLRETFGESVDPAIKYLKELVEEPEAEQQEYFTKFAEDIEEDLRYYRERLATAPSVWEDEEKKPTRAWMRFSKSFGMAWRVYVEQRAETRTRLRLLAIDASLLGSFKAGGSVPRDLSAFPTSLRTDPYSGRNLVYVSRGADYKLYSVGPNGIDDGGDSGDLSVDR